MIDFVLFQEAGETGVGGAPASSANPISGAPPSSGAPAPPTPSSAPTEPVKSTFELPQNWLESVPEEMRHEPSLKTVHSFEGLVKSFVHAQKAIGHQKVAVPGKDASASEWGEVFQKLGRPESPDGYEIKAPEGFELDKEFLGGFKKKAHEAGMLPRQVEEVFSWYAEHEKSKASLSAQKLQEKQQSWEGELKKEFGDAFDQEMGRVAGFLKEFGGEEVFASIDEAGLGSDPKFIKTMHKIAKEFGAEAPIHSGSGSRSGAMTPQEAKIRINEIMSDRSGPYFNKSNPRHGDAVNEMQKLFKLANPGG